MATVRQTGQQISIFDLGAVHYIDDLDNATITCECKDEDASSVKDVFEYAWATKKRVQIEADVFVNASAFAVLIWGSSIAVSYNTGGVTYAGEFLVQQVVHTTPKDGLQRQKVVLKGQGVITATAPGG